MKVFKIISLCLCFSVVAFATDYNIKHEIKSIENNRLLAKKDSGQSQDSRPVCDESATVVGFGDYNANGSVDLCYSDGTGFFEFAWEGGCVLQTLSYSGGDLDATPNNFTSGLFFFGFEAGVPEDFVLVFDDGSTAVLEGAVAYCGSACSDAGFGATCFDGGCADSEADCPVEGECADDQVLDCDGSNECISAAWIGDGYCDGTAQQYGADLCCYDSDGGDCTEAECAPPSCGDGVCNGDETEETCPEDCSPSEECADCEFDWTQYGAECCDLAWTTFQISCADLEANYGWDCAGCNCPGDLPPSCGDGQCNGDETFESCPEDCTETGCSADEVADCDASGECWTAAWIGDGFCDGTEQQYGADLCCYDNDGGDCTEAECAGSGPVDECGDGACTGSETAENCPEDCDPCIDYDLDGDVNNDETVNVLDIVSVVNHVLGDELVDCEFGAADMNSDSIINVLDIVSIVNVILGTGRTTSDATSATMNIDGSDLSISRDGFVSAIQMTLSHGSDFSIDLTDDAMVAEYRTDSGMTRLIVVLPENDHIFTATGDYVVDEVIVANSNTILSVVEPSAFTLTEAYPNPFNPSTSLSINMPENGYVSVKAYNLAGQVVSVITEGSMDAGSHTMTWDASSLSSGVYLITAEYAGSVATQKVMLMK